MCESLLGDLTMVVPLRKEFHGVLTSLLHVCTVAFYFAHCQRFILHLKSYFKKKREKREMKRTTSVKLPFIEVKHKQGSTKIPISEHLIVFIIIIFLGHKLASVAASSSECNRAI